MPYKNKADHFYPLIGVYLYKDEPHVYEGVKDAAKSMNVSIPKYIRLALCEKLAKDGYIKEDDYKK